MSVVEAAQITESDTMLDALVGELRRQAHDFRHHDSPPFVGPTDTPTAVFVRGQLDLVALVRALQGASG